MDKLPIELIECIGSYIEDAHILSLRLVSKVIEANSFDIFGKRLFGTRYFYLTLLSLRDLVQIAGSSRLSPYVVDLALDLEPGMLSADVTMLAIALRQLKALKTIRCHIRSKTTKAIHKTMLRERLPSLTP
jgi:hypothetical protein